MADLYDMCNNMSGILALGRCLSASVPILFPSILSTIWVIIFISSLRSMGSMPRAALNSTVLFWFLSVAFYAAQWVNEYTAIFSTVALALAAIFAYSSAKNSQG